MVGDLVDATGKRKTAVARVRMRAGTGNVIVNGKQADEYFSRVTDRQMVQQPFDVTHLSGRYDVYVSLHGGGPSGQAGALRHGIARAIEKLDPSQRLTLKKAGYLRRDAREKERKKYGQKGARARFQFSKR